MARAATWPFRSRGSRKRDRARRRGPRRASKPRLRGRSSLLQVPNLITLLRLGLIPVVAYYLAREHYDLATALFLAAALTDFADGYIARRFKLTSRLGAVLDPVADKANMLVATVMLALQELLPLWLAVAMVGRDVVIVAGALAYRLALGNLEVSPTWLSKINTVLEFALLLVVMSIAADWLEGGSWLTAMFVVVLATVVASGVQYVALWGRKAMVERRRRKQG